MSEQMLGKPRAGSGAHRFVALSLAAAVPGLITLAGLPYYLSPPAVRARAELHPWLRPSGYVGQSIGMVALLVFLFLWLYPLRKRFRWLAFTGAVSRWLDVHVAAALLMPLLVGVHAGWRFDGLIGLGYLAILVVCASGIIGRYLYTRIPRGKTGVELGRAGVAAERRGLLTEIAAATGLTPGELERRLSLARSPSPSHGVLGTFFTMVGNDLTRWHAVRQFGRRLATTPGVELDSRALKRVVRLASREAALAQQVRMLDATQRLFRYWHVAHRPVALTALVAVVVHVSVAIALGATWFW